MLDLWRQWRRIAYGYLRTPGFTIAAVLTLALGIGSTTSVFSVAYGILFKPLPMHDADRIVALWGHNPTLQPDHVPLSGEEYRAFAHETRTLQSVAAYDFHGVLSVPVTFTDSAASIHVALVTGGFFNVLGVQPRMGRALQPSDDAAGATGTAVISDGLWRRAFGADPSVVGKTVRFWGSVLTIVGVAPRGFDFPLTTELWVPAARALRARDTLPGFYDIVGRLKPRATSEQTASELLAFLRRPEEPHSAAERLLANSIQPVVKPVSRVIVGDVRGEIGVVAGAVALLILVTCINVANLLLIRGLSRRREFAVRNALGASSKHIARQVLMESGFLAVLGGILGAVCAWAAVKVFISVAPPDLPRIDQIEVSVPILAGTMLLTVAVALASGTLPAISASHLSSAEYLRERHGTASGLTQRTRLLLIGAQVAIAVWAMVAAGIVARSFERLSHLDLGFSTEHVVLAHIGTSRSAYATPSAYLNALDEVTSRIRALPDVISATTVFQPPFSGATGVDIAYTLPGDSPEQQAGRPMLDLLIGTPDYFRTLGIPIRRGRGFTEADRDGSQKVVIVDETAARQIWPGADPIGKLMGLGPNDWVVVGVAGATRYRNLLAPRATLYIPQHQINEFPSYVAVRTRGDPSRLASQLRPAARSVNSAFLISQVSTLDDITKANLARPRLDALLLLCFGAFILLLTSLGLYSIAATYVQHREAEIAIRMALGARPKEIAMLVFVQGARVVAVGLVVGIAAAIIGSTLLRSIVFGVRTLDPASFSAAIALVLMTSIAAFSLPIARAVRTNPAQALRQG